jgi:MFS family permease
MTTPTSPVITVTATLGGLAGVLDNDDIATFDSILNNSINNTEEEEEYSMTLNDDEKTNKRNNKIQPLAAAAAAAASVGNYGTRMSSSSNSSAATSGDPLLSLLVPRHSDFTIPTSNRRRRRQRRDRMSSNSDDDDYDSQSPPGEIESQSLDDDRHDNANKKNGNDYNSGHSAFSMEQPRTMMLQQQLQQARTTTSVPSSCSGSGVGERDSNQRRSIFHTSIQRRYGTESRFRNNTPPNLWSHYQEPEQHSQVQQQLLYQNLYQNHAGEADSTVPFYRAVGGGVLALHQHPGNGDASNVSSNSDNHKNNYSVLDNGYGGAAPVLWNDDNAEDDDNHTPESLGSVLSVVSSMAAAATANAVDNHHHSPPPTNIDGWVGECENDDAPDRQQYQITLTSGPGPPTLSPLTSPTKQQERLITGLHGSNDRHGHSHTHTTASQNKREHHQRVHETRHAQSLLLGLAFAAVWSPSNLMAPNLTEMAAHFHFTSDADRDLYLGSYCALAVSVFSLPVAAAIGLWTDVGAGVGGGGGLASSRKLLFVGTVLGGAIAAAATACAQTYWQLWMARWISGGFMAGSVPVAFSFLGDLFEIGERNAASSGLTAMMGLGIIAGQVYAGAMVQPWYHAFTVSAVVTAVLGVLCLFLVKDPVRGGTEKVLQEMIKGGARYERKLTWSAFHHMIQNNRSNFILLWQGFFSSLPWGVIFVFLNDYLSQERGFSVPDATYLVAVFGVGCAVGGILGGYFGQFAMDMNRSYLPLFMSITTILGVLPFLGLLNLHFSNAQGLLGNMCAGFGGLIASLPSVNVRPCLINVNPPESRGASLTAANLLINLGRGVGPCCITLIQSVGKVDRKFAFNVTVRLLF